MLNVTKIFCLDENQKFPICHVCQKELHPFSITEEELLTLNSPTIVSLMMADLLFEWKDKYILYLCTSCISHIRENST
jgi:hypothetical protein